MQNRGNAKINDCALTINHLQLTFNQITSQPTTFNLSTYNPSLTT
jgi:hypothetical protein